MQVSIKLSKNFTNRLLDFISKDEVVSFVTRLNRAFVPVQKISDAMIETTQVGFNIDTEKGLFTINDPFQLSGVSKTKFLY